MDLYGDIPSPDASEEANLAAVPLVLTRSVVEERDLKVKIQVNEEVQPKEQEEAKPAVAAPVLSSPAPLRFIPPALRNKTMRGSPSIAKTPGARPRQSPNTTAASLPSVLEFSPAETESNALNMLLDEVEDEYDPTRPNEYSQYLQEVDRRLQEDAEDQKMLDVLQALAAEVPDDTESQEPGSKDDFGLRMMRKYGWKEGQGLGREAQGISVPLMAKRTSERAGVIINPDHSFQHSLSSILLLEVSAQKVSF